MENQEMKHIITLTPGNLANATVEDILEGAIGCGECQTSCQSACKTSCTVANQECERQL